MLSLIVAMSRNQVIGRSGGLPWRLRSDLIRFKNTTMGHTLIMGRKTFESIGRVLPGRKTIVVSRAMPPSEGVEIARTFEEAIQMARGDAQPFIVGGGEIYLHSLAWADRLYLTLVDAEVEGETHFPKVDFGRYQLRQRELIPASEVDEFAHTFEIWDRVGPSDQSTP